MVLLAPLVFLLIEAGSAGASTVAPPHLPPAHRHPAVEHHPAHRGGHRPLRRHRHPGGVVCRADRPARSADLGGPGGCPLRHPRLRGELRVGVTVHLDPGLPGRGGGHDPGRLSVGLPTGCRQPAGRRPGAGGGGPQPRGWVGSALSSGSPSARPRGAILGGCLLVALVLLAEYGAFEILGYQTFTTEIFTEFQVSFNLPVASRPGRWFCSFWVWSCSVPRPSARGRGRVVRIGPQAQRVGQPHRLGKATVPVLFGFVLLVGLALGVPVGACVYWTFEGGAHALTGVSIASATWHTALYSGTAAALATLMALPVALLASAARAPRFATSNAAHIWCWPCPGIVIAFALSYFAERYADGFLYQSAPLLILAYAILFFPLALVGVRASVAHAPVDLEEVARSLGLGRLAVLRPGHPSPDRSRAGGRPSAWSCWRRSPNSPPPSFWCRPESRPSPPSSGPTSRTSPTVRPHRSP